MLLFGSALTASRHRAVIAAGCGTVVAGLIGAVGAMVKYNLC